jgi:hypothetical protein
VYVDSRTGVRSTPVCARELAQLRTRVRTEYEVMASPLCADARAERKALPQWHAVDGAALRLGPLQRDQWRATGAGHALGGTFKDKLVVQFGELVGAAPSYPAYATGLTAARAAMRAGATACTVASFEAERDAAGDACVMRGTFLQLLLRAHLASGHVAYEASPGSPLGDVELIFAKRLLARGAVLWLTLTRGTARENDAKVADLAAKHGYVLRRRVGRRLGTVVALMYVAK